MESPHPDERPHKKRRFFAEESSPPQVHPIRPASPPSIASPPPAIPDAASPFNLPNEGDRSQDSGDSDSFDTVTLQAIVGELPLATLQKLKAVSGNDVQRGMPETSVKEVYVDPSSY